MSAETIAGIRKDRLDAFAAREAAVYAKSRPKAAKALQARAGTFWAACRCTGWRLADAAPAAGQAGLRRDDHDIDGHRLERFLLGDTGSMFGHSPEPVAKAIRRQARHGLTYMLPTQAALEAGRLLTERFGDFRWQIATTATDANRFALRVARAITGRPKVLVFNGCYHGTVDDTFVSLETAAPSTAPALWARSTI